MKVLVLCHRLPYPPDHGGRIRGYHLVRHLARQHDVTVASLIHPGDDARAIAALEQFVPRVITERVDRVSGTLRALQRAVQGRPASFAFFESPRLAARIDELLARESFDLIVALSSSVAPYVAHVAVPKLLDFADMDSLKWRAFAPHHAFPMSRVFALEGARLAREEALLAARFDAITLTTPEELAAARQICGPVESDWFANGVDHETFTPSDIAAVPDSLCFLGRMDYFPNVEGVRRFVRESWPQIRRARPAASLTIIGADPVRAVRRLDGHSGVRVTGTVADVRPLARRAAVSIAPLTIAPGIQNKILESMAMGLAVVTTPAAARGIDAIAGEHLVVADGADPFAAAVVRLLEDEPARRRIAGAGRERVRVHHDWATCLQRFDATLRRCLHQQADVDADAMSEDLRRR